MIGGGEMTKRGNTILQNNSTELEVSNETMLC